MEMGPQGKGYNRQVTHQMFPLSKCGVQIWTEPFWYRTEEVFKRLQAGNSAHFQVLLELFAFINL